MDKKVKSKKQKKICGLPESLFNRLHFLTMFEDDASKIDLLGLDSYVPRIIGSCSISARLPNNPVDIEAFRRVIILPGQTPYFEPPNLPSSLPTRRKIKIIVCPTYTSLLPLLMTATHAGVDIKKYHFVTYRNSMRKLAMNDEDFVINVERRDSTLYVRRFPKYKTVDKSDVGFRFEEMCTTKKNSDFDFNQLLDGQIGEFKILMMAEIDAIRRENNEALELKAQKTKQSKWQHDWWLQAYLAGTKSIIHGRQEKDDATIISSFDEYHTSELSDQEKKSETFNRLHCTLQFLFANIKTERSYILRGYKDKAVNRRVVALYEVINGKDKGSLTFITNKLLNTFSVNSK